MAGVPVSTDDPDAIQRLGGNKVSNMFTTLATNIEDPVERLQAIHDVTSAAKEMHNILGADMLADWSEYTPPRPYSWFMRHYSRLGLAERHAPPINLVVSNVPGPREPLYVAGARMEGIYSVGPILEGIGLNVTVWSYCDQLNVGVIACREHIADPHEITDGMATAIGRVARHRSFLRDARSFLIACVIWRSGDARRRSSGHRRDGVPRRWPSASHGQATAPARTRHHVRSSGEGSRGRADVAHAPRLDGQRWPQLVPRVRRPWRALQRRRGRHARSRPRYPQRASLPSGRLRRRRRGHARRARHRARDRRRLLARRSRGATVVAPASREGRGPGAVLHRSPSDAWRA